MALEPLISADQKAISDQVKQLDGELAELRARIDLFFLGLEKKNPTSALDEYRKRILKLKGEFIRNTGLKFRVQTLYAKFQAFERLWLKSLREIEEGTYSRDIFRLRRRKGQPEQTSAAPSAKAVEPPPPTKDLWTLEDLESDLPDELFAAPSAGRPSGTMARPPSPPPPPPPPLSPAGAASSQPTRPTDPGQPRPPVVARAPGAPSPSAAAEGGLSEERVKRIYEALVAAKTHCRESTDGVTLQSVEQALRKQVPSILKASGAKAVDFKIVIKDGKASLKAVPR